MDDAVRTRDAAREALSDVEPADLRRAIDDRLVDAAVTPGVFALITARALDPDADSDDAADRAAGVQLIYEGLRLTRRLAHEVPWSGTPAADIDADLEILAADVLVSRGFYVLARTDAASAAVEVVRAFGRDQTLRDRPDADVDALDRNLEEDVCELAVVAGSTTAGGDPPAELLEYARELATGYDGEFPPAGQALSDATADRIAAISEERVSAIDR